MPPPCGDGDIGAAAGQHPADRGPANGPCAPLDLYGGFWVKWFLSSSAPAVAARRVDRLELLEIELGNCLEHVGQSRSFEVVRQVVEPGAVFVLQIDQRGYCRCPTLRTWRETRRR